MLYPLSYGGGAGKQFGKQSPGYLAEDQSTEGEQRPVFGSPKPFAAEAKAKPRGWGLSARVFRQRDWLEPALGSAQG